VDKPEVQFLSVHSAMETDWHVNDIGSITDSQQKEVWMEGTHKRHIASTEELENQDNSKRIREQDNEDNPNNTKLNNANKKACSTAKIVIQNILTMSVFHDQKQELWVAIIYPKKCCYLMIKFLILLLIVWMIQKFQFFSTHISVSI